MFDTWLDSRTVRVTYLAAVSAFVHAWCVCVCVIVLLLNAACTAAIVQLLCILQLTFCTCKLMLKLCGRG